MQRGFLGSKKSLGGSKKSQNRTPPKFPEFSKNDRFLMKFLLCSRGKLKKGGISEKNRFSRGKSTFLLDWGGFDLNHCKKGVFSPLGKG